MPCKPGVGLPVSWALSSLSFAFLTGCFSVCHDIQPSNSGSHHKNHSYKGCVSDISQRQLLQLNDWLVFIGSVRTDDMSVGKGICPDWKPFESPHQPVCFPGQIAGGFHDDLTTPWVVAPFRHQPMHISQMNPRSGKTPLILKSLTHSPPAFKNGHSFSPFLQTE